jgi:uncharacterized protein (TIGR02246 family)
VDVDAWIETYRHAWQTGDDRLLATLFAHDARYRASPFREPYEGRDAIRSYWRHATATQHEVNVEMGRPFVVGDRVAVEWWATMVDDGEELTLPGCLLLSFDANGLCNDLREYWNVERGRRQPPFAGWGK